MRTSAWSAQSRLDRERKRGCEEFIAACLGLRGKLCPALHEHVSGPFGTQQVVGSHGVEHFKEAMSQTVSGLE